MARQSVDLDQRTWEDWQPATGNCFTAQPATAGNCFTAAISAVALSHTKHVDFAGTKPLSPIESIAYKIFI